MAGNIRILTSLLRDKSGVSDRIPVDVDEIVRWSPITFAEIQLDGFLGLFIPGKVSGMLINANQRPEQRRFTVAHELGHFSLPGHEPGSVHFCLEEDLSSRADNKPLEREANEFAAELLMPRHLFAREIREKDPSFALVRRLASPERFHVSHTACAIRLVELSREPCALVCSSGGRVVWRSWSGSFYYSIPSSGYPVPPTSVAGSVSRGEAPSDDPEEVDRAVWFLPRDETEQVFESTFVIPSLEQVLSLVSVVERE